MLTTLRNACVFCLVLWSVVLLPGHALAQTASLACQDGVPVDGTQLYFTGENNDEGFCEFGGLDHLFSEVICNFVVVMNSVLGSVYCGMQYVLEGIIGLVITVYIAVYGVQILMGLSPMNIKDFMVRLLKIAFVWTFITQSTWAIGWAFYFFFTLAAEGVYWVMSAVAVDITDPTSACYDAAAAGATGFMSVFIQLDEIMCNAIFALTDADEKIVGLFAALFAVLPPVTLLALYWVWVNVKIMVRGLITFLLGISAMAFLIALAPIFLSLMLFQTTYRFFETWLRYMISFSLQIILIFACIALWLLAIVYFIGFFNDLSETVFSYKKVIMVSGTNQKVSNSWGICGFDYYPEHPGGPDYIPGPYIECIGGGEVFSPFALLMDVENGPVPVCNNTETGENDCTKYFYYIIYHLVTLIIICYAFEALMRQAPMIAVYLAGPEYTPMLGQGFGVTRYGQFRALPYSSTSPKSLFFGEQQAEIKGGKAVPASRHQQTFREQMEKLLYNR